MFLLCTKTYVFIVGVVQNRPSFFEFIVSQINFKLARISKNLKSDFRVFTVSKDWKLDFWVFTGVNNIEFFNPHLQNDWNAIDIKSHGPLLKYKHVGGIEMLSTNNISWK